ncbi:hypothetical protein HYU95_04465 [Candidatus Daviesbacteria bacterium]|nr:hypothetical protein [Candidatus Daviesbacteria bacterium]
MSSTEFWVGMLVPPFLKWANPYLKKFFKLTEFDSETKTRVFAKQYPAYFSFLYGLWILALLSTGFIVLLWFMISGPTIFPDKSYATPIFLGLINMIGVWFILGAILDFFFWQISPNNFRDYVILRQIKSGWGYDIKQQISTLVKIGIIYYIFALPIVLYLLLR